VTTFYLGAPEPSWLGRTDVQLFVSHRRLSRYKTLPRALGWWALDSGGFSEIAAYGEWRTTPQAYVDAVMRYDVEIGNLSWAAPQDWMCEPQMLVKTGLTVREHQRRTVENFLLLRELWTADSEPPFMPVLQGWTMGDYLRCADLYEAAGVRLEHQTVVGVGSVCRRQNALGIAILVEQLHQRLVPTDTADEVENNLHGFGVKTSGLSTYGPLLGSADSMAWSMQARYESARPGCEHRNCANCLLYALEWRASLVDRLGVA
jgi:hypothetical protein